MNYTSILKDRGLKVTPQRVQILSIMQKYGHVSVDELFLKITQLFPSISLATLYKNLHIMIDALLVSELKIPNMKPKYEISKAPHAHLLCEGCNSFIDFAFSFNNITKEVGQKSHYELHSSTLIFCGICPECQNN